MLKYALTHLALNRIPTGKMLFMIGKGGDGKGMDAVLEGSLFGEENHTNLDFSVFTDRSEFRKSAGAAHNKIAVRVQECSSTKAIASDQWKRFISGETLDLRVNYG